MESERTTTLGRKARKSFITDFAGNLGKLPPQAVDLEEAVLGALMLEKDALTTVIDILKPESFYKDANQEVFKAIVDLFNNSEPVDMLTVANQLRELGKLEVVGGASGACRDSSHVGSRRFSEREYHCGRGRITRCVGLGDSVSWESDE